MTFFHNSKLYFEIVHLIRHPAFARAPLLWTFESLSGIWFVVLGFSGLRFGHKYLHPGVCVSALLALVLGLWLTQRLGKLTLFLKEDIFLIPLLGGVLFAGLAHQTGKELNYIFAYLFVFVFCNIVLRSAMRTLVNAESLLKWNALGIFIVSGLAGVELVCNIAGITLFKTILDPWRVIPADAITWIPFYGGLGRSYSLCGEPTEMAQYLCGLGPIAAWYVYNRFRSKLLTAIFGGVLGVGIFSSFSLSGFLLAPTAVLITIATHRSWRHAAATYKGLIALLLLAACAGFAHIFIDFSWLTEVSLVSKLISQKGPRFTNFWGGVSDVSNNLVFGAGLGVHSIIEREIINWYLLLASEAGLPTALSAVGFVLTGVSRMAQSDFPGSPWLMVGYVESIMHLATMSTFYLLTPWAILILFYIMSQPMRIKIRLNFDGLVKSQN